LKYIRVSFKYGLDLYNQEVLRVYIYLKI